MADNNGVPANKNFQPDIESVEEFLERFKVQNFQKLSSIKDDKQKAMLLANVLPVDILVDIQRRLKPKKLSEATYDEIEAHLTSLHSTKKSVIGASVAFLHRKQLPNESIESFAKQLNDLASACSYEACCLDRMLRDVFVSGLRNKKIMTNLIHEVESKKFHEMIEKAKLIEQCHLDVADINPAGTSYPAGTSTNQTNKVYRKQQKNVYSNKFDNNNRRGHQNNNRQGPHVNNRQQFQPPGASTQQKISANYICCRCGLSGVHQASMCPHIKTKCNKCLKPGHLAKMCRTKSSGSSNTNKKFQRIHQEMDEEEDPAKYFTLYRLEDGADDTSRTRSTAQYPPSPRPSTPTANKFNALIDHPDSDISSDNETVFSCDALDCTVSQIKTVSHANNSVESSSKNNHFLE